MKKPRLSPRDSRARKTVAPRLRFFGVAAYELVNTEGRHILVDPFLDENPGSPIKSADLDRVDLIVVSHAAFDHMGDTEALARRTGAPVICGGEVKNFLMAKGLPASQLRATTWGISVEVGGVTVHPVECHHWSQIKMPDGTFASGVPMSFVIPLSPHERFYHYGDTALFSDLKLIAQLYRPTVGCVGITNPLEILARVSGPGRLLTGEMTPEQGALAVEWLRLKTALPCHYINPNCPEVAEFERHLASARRRGRKVPRSRVLSPGEWLELS